MADDVDAGANQLQGIRAQVEGLVTDIQTIHERLDSTISSTTERCDQLDLAQTAAKATLDSVVARLDALHTTVAELQQGYGGDSDQDDGDRRGRARRVPRRPGGNDSFSKIKFKIPPFNGKYDPAAYLDWELEVEQKFFMP